MDEISDNDLLRDYAAQKSEPAFEALVARHIDLVYSAAIRQVGNEEAAKEVTQITFALLARKAGNLPRGISVAGWLYRTARFAALSELRAARRRAHYEREAQMQAETESRTEPESTWAQVGPLLDELLSQLGSCDREAVVLRFFKERSLAEVGLALGTDQHAAQKRVSRAIDKLRRMFLKRGLTLSAVSLCGMLSTHSVQAAPSGLSAFVSTLGSLQAAGLAGSKASLLAETIKTMAWAKCRAYSLVALVAMFGMTTTISVLRIDTRPAAVREQVFSIVATNSWVPTRDGTELELVAALGPQVLVPLRELIEWRPPAGRRSGNDGWLQGALRFFSRAPDPRLNAENRQKAAQIVSELGAGAARPLAGALCRAVDRPDFDDPFVLRSLYWAIPESPEAVAALGRVLSRPPRSSGIFGLAYATNVWPRVPYLAPMLVTWLENAYSASEVIEALGALGPKATAAAPFLIQVCEKGFSVPREELYPDGIDPGLLEQESRFYLHNRRAALRALGRLGLVGPEVMAAFDRGLMEISLRPDALVGLLALGPSQLHRVTEAIGAVRLPRSHATVRLIEQIGRLGTGGGWALPWLRQYASEDYVLSLDKPQPNDLESECPAEDIRRSAIVAICRIDALEVKHYIRDLAAQLGDHADAQEVLGLAGAFPLEVAAILEPELAAPEPWQRIVAADVLLRAIPEHPGAKATLLRAAREGELNLRTMAALRIWSRTGEIGVLSPLLAEAAVAGNPRSARAVARYLADGSAFAPQMVPWLQAALWHKDRLVREHAARALQKLAPGEMPTLSAF